MENEIFVAIGKGEIDVVRQLLEREPQLIKAKKPPHARTLLHYAVFCKQINLVQYFAGLVDDIDEKDGRGCTCLQYTAREGAYGIAEILIGSGADVNAREGGGMDGKTPLHRAAENSLTDIVVLLLDHGADPQATITRRPYKLHEILEKQPDLKWILTPKDCARDDDVRKVFEKFEKKPFCTKQL